MRSNNKYDCRGSMGLSIYYKNGKKYYKKQVELYLKKFILHYIKALSKELDIPMIDYSFIENGTKYYYICTSYDKCLPDYQVIISPFEAETLDEFLVKMKFFCSKFDNGTEIYDKYLKQILFSILINDPDRTVDNTKFYKKGNLLDIAPYMDINMVFDLQESDALFMDFYYYFPKDMEREIEAINKSLELDGSDLYDVDRLNKEFQNDFNEKYNSVYSFNKAETFKTLEYIYEELNDKSIFKKIINIDYNDLEKKYSLIMSKNAKKIIKTMFDIRQNAIKIFYEDKLLRIKENGKISKQKY